METIEYNSKMGHAYEVLVFKGAYNVELLHDYMDKLDKQFFRQENDS